MYNKRNKRHNKQQPAVIDLSQKFETLHPDHGSLGVVMYINTWGLQYTENNAIDNKKIIVNDNVLFLSGFQPEKYNK